MQKKTYTTGEVAHICGVSSDTVSRWFDQGQIEGFRLGASGDRRIPRDKLYTFMLTQGIPIDRLPDDTPRILIIDDDPYYLNFIEQALTTEGYTEVCTAGTAFNAGTLLTEHNPHLIIIDLNHSELTVPQLSQYAKSRTETSRSPILGLSLYIEQDNKLTNARNCDKLLLKPFTTAQLLEQVHTLIGQKG